MWYKIEDGEVKLYKSLDEIYTRHNLQTRCMGYDDDEETEITFDKNNPRHWEEVMKQLGIKEFIEYDDNEIVAVYSLDGIADAVFYILNKLILQGDEKDAFDEYVGDDVKNFNMRCLFHPFTMKRMKEICKIWNGGHIFGLRATPVNNMEINFKY